MSEVVRVKTRTVRHVGLGFVGKVIAKVGNRARVAWDEYGPDGKKQNVLINPCYVKWDEIEDFDPYEAGRKEIERAKQEQRDRNNRYIRIHHLIGDDDMNFLREYLSSSARS